MALDSAAIRRDFPILQRQVHGRPLVYLDNAATSQKPQQVIDALTQYYATHNSNVHRGVHTLSVEATEMYEGARPKVRQLINAPEDKCIIWTRGTTEALNMVAKECERTVRQGDNIVTTVMEHHSNLVPWQQLALRRGATLRYIQIDEDGNLDEESAQREIDGRTRVVAVTHSSNVLGSVVDVRRLGEMAHAVGAVLAVDAAQTVPHMPVDVQGLDCDFLTFSLHKMLGPTGVGVLYGKREALERMEPQAYGGDMISEVTYEGARWNELPYKLEAGTPNIADVIAAGAAVDYLLNLGMDAVWSHTRDLTAHALARFAELERYSVIGPGDSPRRNGVISFVHSEVHSHDIGQVLDRQGIAIRTGHHCAMPLVHRYNTSAASRASFYIYNTRKEADALIDGLLEVERYFKA